MNNKTRFLENLILTMVLVGGMLGVYLYAGHQQQVAAKASPTQAPVEPTSEPVAAAPEVSADGRRKDAVLQTFSDAGYEVVFQSEERCRLSDDGKTLAEMVLSLQGDRVNGLVLMIPLPKKVQSPKNPTLVEDKLTDQYRTQLQTVKEALSPLLTTALRAIDPYETVALTTRMYWLSLAQDALDEEKETSDSSEPIRFRIYFSEEKEQTVFCLLLQKKQ